MKVLCIYLTWSPSGRQWQLDAYHSGIEYLSKQEPAVDIVLCDNSNNSKVRTWLEEHKKQYGCKAAIFIPHQVSVNFAFNYAAWRHGKWYDWVAFVASDAYYTKPNDIAVLLADAQMNQRCAVISPQASNDMCYTWGHLCQYKAERDPTRVLPGQAMNGHTTFFDRRFMQAYDYKRVDVLFGPRTEPFIGYMCAAIGLEEYVSHRVQIDHWRGPHNRSKGLDAPTGGQDYPIGYTYDEFYDIVKKGGKLGLGFEELYGEGYEHAVMANRDAFDENWYAKSNDLYVYIKEHLFQKVNMDELKADIYE